MACEEHEANLNSVDQILILPTGRRHQLPDDRLGICVMSGAFS
jgi:hypothetical protein